jgi:hypothetical protein
VRETAEALELLRTKAPQHYAVVGRYVGVIECVASGSGMAAQQTPPRYLVGDVTRAGGTIWYAGTIAHDAYHSKLYHEYKVANPGRPVPASVWTGREAEAKCLEFQVAALAAMGASERTLDNVRNAINTDYWDIPQSSRTW